MAQNLAREDSAVVQRPPQSSLRFTSPAQHFSDLEISDHPENDEDRFCRSGSRRGADD
jgi:hypothetical protein